MLPYNKFIRGKLGYKQVHWMIIMMIYLLMDDNHDDLPITGDFP
jgi:hypothetical protein